jgi:hypothetical protein
MERLPDDILLLILQKVASQAPLVSLLQLSCVCRALHHVVSQNHALWEHAFYWPRQRPDTPEAGALKEVVEVQLGGFKGFVTARLRLLTKRHMQPSLQEVLPTEPTCPTSCSEVVLLFIVKLAAGKVTMWGVAPLENQRLLSEDHPGKVLDQTFFFFFFFFLLHIFSVAPSNFSGAYSTLYAAYLVFRPQIRRKEMQRGQNWLWHSPTALLRPTS